DSAAARRIVSGKLVSALYVLDRVRFADADAKEVSGLLKDAVANADWAQRQRVVVDWIRELLDAVDPLDVPTVDARKRVVALHTQLAQFVAAPPEQRSMSEGEQLAARLALLWSYRNDLWIEELAAEEERGASLQQLRLWA